MKPIGHTMILASAGSGKTYALTNRFVRLLAQGSAPDRIAALTFTRKAAGEFFDEILKKLAKAAGDEAAAGALAREIGFPGLGPADFRAHLRAVVEAMPRLNLGTLDGFFARVVAAFPLELGLGGPPEIMEVHAARLERARVLQQLFARSGGPPDPAQQGFIEAFKLATFGTEEKKLRQCLDKFLDDYAELFLEAPIPAVWGHPDRIWPAGCAWLAAIGQRNAAVEALRPSLPWDAMTEKQQRRWDAFFAAWPEWSPGAPLVRPLEYILQNAFETWPAVAEIRIERKELSLPPAASAALRQWAAGVVGAELDRRLKMTRGICQVLQGYESAYDAAVRRAGRLTFADLPRLLRPDLPGPGRALSREAGEEGRLFIDWRLDAQIDHWLLDEFQDTSFGQWSVLRNLIDEVVQDPEGRRSFFYVGDVKQAIFSWRSGDPRLFREIFDHYNAVAPGTIGEERLDLSWRSAPAVIELVNQLFSNAAALRHLFPGEGGALDRWAREWRPHASAHPALAGFTEWRMADDEVGRFNEALAIVRETGALQRGLTVAVLVRDNATAARLAEHLRQADILAVAESDLKIGTDNPLTCALLALCRAAAHPGDTAAAAHLGMTPLGALLRAEGLAAPAALTERLLGELHAQGFQRTLESWARRLEACLEPDDTFSRDRGRQLGAAARLFDESGGRTVAEFLQYIEHYVRREAEPAHAVRVMTVHKAKGLGFDVVILPDLEGTKLNQRRDGLAVQKSRRREVEWILQLPARDFFSPDDTLAAYVAEAEGDALYEELCILYVAVTRAKRATYLVTEPIGTSRSANFPKLLRDTLGESWTSGTPRWFDAAAAAPAVELPPPPRILDPGRVRPAPRRRSRRPAAEVVPVGRAERLFTLAEGRAVDFGSAVHACFAAIEWHEPGTSAPFAAAPAGSPPAEAAACLTEPALAAVWARPAGAAEVWRERAFEVLLDGAWVSGVFDRVVVTRDPAGRAQGAALYDFKTDRVDPAGALGEGAIRRYADQMDLYRQAVAVLTGIPVAGVTADLVLTQPRRRVAV